MNFEAARITRAAESARSGLAGEAMAEIAETVFLSGVSDAVLRLERAFLLPL